MTNLSAMALMPIEVYDRFVDYPLDMYINKDKEGIYIDLNRYFDMPLSYTSAHYIDSAIHNITGLDTIRCYSHNTWFKNYWDNEDRLYHRETT